MDVVDRDRALVLVEFAGPDPPGGVEGGGEDEDPGAAQPVGPQHHQHGDAGQQGDADLDRGDREGDQDAGEDVAAPVVPFQRQEGAEPERDRGQRVDVEGPEQDLTGEAEEKQKDAGGKRGQWPDPAPRQLESEAGRGAEGDDVDQDKGGVVGAEEGEGRFIDQLAAELQVAVVGAEQVFGAERVELDDLAGVLDHAAEVEHLVDAEALAVGRGEDQGGGERHRDGQHDPGAARGAQEGDQGSARR